MSFLKKIADQFNGTARPSDNAVRRSVGRMKTRDGRLKHLKLLDRHPGFVSWCDKRGKTALYRAAEANDTEVMEALIAKGINKCTYHDAIYAASLAGHQAAFDLLLKNGAVVTADHLHLATEMAIVMGEYPERGTDPKPYERALEMMKAVYVPEPEKPAVAAVAEIPVTVELPKKIHVRGPLKLKSRSGFLIPD